MSSTAVPALFQPIQVGDITLGHRVVLAPLTRFRADKANVHTDMGLEYYQQRASVPGTLLISEATFISPKAGGMFHVPGIWNDEQIAAWRKVRSHRANAWQRGLNHPVANQITDAVHAKGSYIFLQLWSLGRCERPAALDYVAPSCSPLCSSADYVPRELTKNGESHPQFALARVSS